MPFLARSLPRRALQRFIGRQNYNRVPPAVPNVTLFLCMAVSRAILYYGYLIGEISLDDESSDVVYNE